MFSGEGYQLGSAHHVSVLPHDLAAQPALLQPGDAHQVHSGLGVPPALKHSARTRLQRKHVSRTAEILRPGIRFHRLHRSDRPLYGRNTRAGRDVVDGHGEGRAVIVGIVRDHLPQAQLLGQSRAHRHTYQALAVAGHEVDIGSGGVTGSADQVSLILPVGIVDDHDNLSLAESLGRLLDGIEFTFHILKSVFL